MKERLKELVNVICDGIEGAINGAGIMDDDKGPVFRTVVSFYMTLYYVVSLFLHTIPLTILMTVSTFIDDTIKNRRH